jgi:hypothetical protein
LGVSNATIRAKLIGGNEAVGYQEVAAVDAKTDMQWSVKFQFKAGTHCEEVSVSVEVVDNPYSPWFLPKVKTPIYLVQPAKGGDDSVTMVAYQLMVWHAPSVRANQAATWQLVPMWQSSPPNPNI